MTGLRARVVKGRILVDEPSDLPEGTELVLVVDDGGDELDEIERDALHESIHQGLEDVRAGRVEAAEKVIARRQAKR